MSIFLSWHACANNVRVVTEHLPPYQIVENGKVVGGSAYLIMKEVLKRAKIEAPSEVFPWARAYKMGLSRDNTIIYSITKSLEREPLFKWIGQLYHLKYSFISTKSNKNLHIEKTSDALNYTAVSVRDSFEAQSLERLGFVSGVNLILVVNYSSVWEMLKRGRADITYANELLLKSANLEEPLFKTQGVVVEEFELYVAANLNTDEKVLDNLTTAFQSVKNDVSFKKLFNIYKDE